jgi:hypothetical protein
MSVYCVEGLHAHGQHQQRRARVEVGEDLCDVWQHQQVLELQDLVRHQRPAHVVGVVIGVVIVAVVVVGWWHGCSCYDT